MEEKKRTSEEEIIEFIGSIFEAIGCKKAEDPAIPTFLPSVIPKKQRWGYKKAKRERGKK